jgi:magnesium chelatase family protein
MPPLTEAEALEVTSIHSLAGLLGEHDRLLTYGSLRAPHHSVDAARLVGGGCPARPGEASLAHLGVLFVDDVQEFKEAALSALDEVLGYGISVIREREKRVILPAGALVVAGALPCPCGFYQTKGRTCTCSPKKIRKYRERLRRQPVVHRSHLRVCLSGDSSDRRAESSAAVRARVVKAREVQRRRFEQGEAGVPLNGWLATQDRARVAKPDGKIRLVLDKAGLLRDAEANVLRVARTIADLDGSDGVLARHVKEALQFAPRPEM